MIDAERLARDREIAEAAVSDANSSEWAAFTRRFCPPEILELLDEIDRLREVQK